MNSLVNDYLLSCTDCCYDVIALSETWLNDATLSRQIFGSDYEVFRCDRNSLNSRKVTGGGVLVAVRNGIEARLIENDQWKCVEQVWVAIQHADHRTFLCVIYFPPDRTRDAVLIDAHTKSVSAIVSMAAPEDVIIIIGDYNLPGLKWHPTHNGFLHPDLAQSTFPTCSCNILDTYSTATLQQINDVVNENGRTLDLCFVSVQDIAPKISTALSPLVKCVPHHPPLHLSINVNRLTAFNHATTSVSYNFIKADFESICDVLSTIDWDNELDNDNVDAATQTFSNVLAYVIDRHVPKRVISSSTHPRWQTRELRRLKKVKRWALRRFSRNRTLHLREHYLQVNQRYKNMSRWCFSSYKRGLQAKMKRNPKSFWKYVNEQRKEAGLPSSMDLNGEIGSSRDEICRLFSKKFASVFVNEQLPLQHIAEAAENVPLFDLPLNNINIDDSTVLEAAAKLKSSSSSGPDGIPSIFLKKCIAKLLDPLRHIFRLSLTSGRFPSLWKNAYIFPVHKKGNKKDIENYRGISALCAASKLFELIVLGPVYFHCKQYISNDQHGFMPKRSTTTNLLSLTTYITDGMEQGAQTDVIYTDLSAAFDKINHDITVAKLERLGFSGPLLRWFQSYLTDRLLNVKIGENTSAAFHATSGVPQGSHLGPLIFVLYFNDVNFLLDGPRLSYADDLKIFFRIYKTSDAWILQERLQICADWCVLNRMVLNPEKCMVISFSRKHNTIYFDYRLLQVSISRKTQVKDLGVVLDEKLTYKQHVSYIVDKASRNLGFIMRIAKDFRDLYCLKSLYCALVRSILEYCSPVWNPHFQNGAERIESVQRRFVRFALRNLPWRNPFQLPSYESRCQLIHLDTLSVRRNVTGALLVSDLLTSRIDCPSILSCIQLQARSRALRNNSLLRIPFRRSNYSANGSIVGLQRLFNRVSSVFDFNLSRDTLKSSFFILLRLPN